MIGLPNYSSGFIEKYIREIGEEVCKKALADVDFWEKYFPESFIGGKINKRFFTDILSLTIEECCTKYESVKNYFEFAFFSSLSIKRIHGKERGRADRKHNRKYYIDMYVRRNVYASRMLVSFLKTKDPESSDRNFEEFQKRMKKELAIINVYIERSIDYGKEIKREHRVAFLDELNIKVCPYCNRQYVIKLDIDMGRPIGDIDHFYSQNYFALFGLSLYNFVPSCKVCNSLFKSDINADIQYPYRMGDDCNFAFEISDSSGILSPGVLFGWNDDFELKVVNDEGKSFDSKKVKREIDFFGLEAQYEIHKEYVRDFLYKKNMVNGPVLTYLKYYGKKHFSLSEEEINEIVYGFDVGDIDLSEKPLAKLTKDLYEKY